MGTVRTRRYRTVPEFYVAARAVRPWTNGAAISSEHTSAAACLGLAGLIALHGAPGNIQPASVRVRLNVIKAAKAAYFSRLQHFVWPRCRPLLRNDRNGKDRQPRQDAAPP